MPKYGKEYQLLPLGDTGVCWMSAAPSLTGLMSWFSRRQCIRSITTTLWGGLKVLNTMRQWGRELLEGNHLWAIKHGSQMWPWDLRGPWWSLANGTLGADRGHSILTICHCITSTVWRMDHVVIVWMLACCTLLLYHRSTRCRLPMMVHGRPHPGHVHTMGAIRRVGTMHWDTWPGVPVPHRLHGLPFWMLLWRVHVAFRWRGTETSRLKGHWPWAKRRTMSRTRIRMLLMWRLKWLAIRSNWVSRTKMWTIYVGTLIKNKRKKTIINNLQDVSSQILRDWN